MENHKVDYLWRVNRIEKYRSIEQVNRLLKSSWKLLAIEQYTAMDGYKETQTYFVLGHVDENTDTE